VLAAAPLLSAAEPVIDIHQHTYYHERSDADLIQHQRGMGVSMTVLLPAGSQYGLAAECGSNESVVALAKRLPGEFRYFANELPDIPKARSVLESYLRGGAIGIGEQKYPVRADSPSIDLVASIAAEFRVPVLMHFEHEHYNTGFTDFERVLRRHPRVNFIGHAQTWWGNISRDHSQAEMYPKARVIAGGLTDQLLSNFPNVFGDLSAGSGLNSMLRDEDHARAFLKRHQDRLLFGSDCNDSSAGSKACTGTQILAAIRRLAEPEVARKLLYGNAAKLLRLG
jgi:predicted TIM-barrel fold metal-dependent hydrolase